ncbi:VOC family protein [Nocardioides marmoraquaticus]
MSDHPRIAQTVIDAEDVRAVAEFYRELFGLQYRPGDEPGDGPDDLEWLVLRDPAGGHQLAFQQVERLVPTTWPEDDVPMQLHLDCTVPDVEALERHRARADELGGRLLLDRSDDPDEPLYVVADPAGHPLCLFVG